jgi:telomerase Cajal body protein 1
MLSSPTPTPLTIESTFHFPSQISAFALTPTFDIDSITFTVASNDQIPMKTRALLPSRSTLDRTYHFVDAYERWPLVTSLKYTTDGSKFLAGTDSKIAVFDTDSRDLKPYMLLNMRNLSHQNGCRGQVLSMDIAPTSRNLAVATNLHNVALFANEGLEGVKRGYITHFHLPHVAPADMSGAFGSGISQVKFSPNGTYLYAACRKSWRHFVFDVRNSRLCLGYFDSSPGSGQKFGFEVVGNGYGGHEVWCGTENGEIKVFRDPYLKEGEIECDDKLSVGNRPVVGVKFVHSGDYFVTVEGKEQIVSFFDDDDEAGAEGEFRGVVSGGGYRPRVRSEGCVKIWSQYPAERDEGDGVEL